MNSEQKERKDFEAELRRQCFQAPPDSAKDLAWCMWKARASIPIPKVELPKLVGTLAEQPDHIRSCIEAYGAACVAADRAQRGGSHADR